MQIILRLFSCFNAILRLAKASEKYPVNLDEVWMLVYSRKSDAVDALQRDFVENDDYQFYGKIRKTHKVVDLLMNIA